MEDPPIALLARPIIHLWAKQHCSWGAFDLGHRAVLTGQCIKSVIYSDRYNNANYNPHNDAILNFVALLQFLQKFFVPFTNSYTLYLLQNVS